MTTHVLKTLPDYFALVRSGEKQFEIRRNDRDFKKGDTIELLEFNDAGYTGELETRVITCVISYPPGLRNGFVALGMKEAK